jgi:WD40 repeat protein
VKHSSNQIPGDPEGSQQDKEQTSTVGSPTSDQEQIIDWDTLHTAREIQGRYVQISEYAEGGIGRILLVRDKFLDREIALKELKVTATDQEEDTVSFGGYTPSGTNLAAKFFHEARITGQLEHPAIVPVHELGRREDGTPYYTMKLIRGSTLGQAIKETKTIQERLKLLPHFLDVCHAIAYAHSRGVLHRDIKPSNIALGAFGETVVVDWGLALVTTEDAETGVLSQESHDGEIQGTPAYMAPEQAMGLVDQIGECTDVYALGAVLYALLTGFAPHKTTTTEDMLPAIIAGDITPIREREPTVPPELADICERSMHVNPQKRYGTAGEVAEDINAFISGGLVRAHTYTFKEHFGRLLSTYRIPLAVGMIFSVLLVVLGVVYQIQLLEERDIAVQERYEAELARELADVEKEKALLENYFVTIGLVESTVRSYGKERSFELLRDCPQPYRNWEWGHLAYSLDTALLTLQVHDDVITGLAVNNDDTRLAISSMNGVVKIWDATSGRILHELPVTEETIRCLSASPQSNLIAAGDGNGDIHLIDFKSGERVNIINAHRGVTIALSFSPDGKRLLSGGWDRKIHEWDLQSLNKTRTFTGHSGAIKDLKHIPYSDRFVSVSDDGTARFWNLDSGVCEISTILEAAHSAALDVDKTGRYVAVMNGQTPTILDAGTGSEVARLYGHTSVMRDLKFAPDGASILTTSHDRTARIWKTGTWQLTSSFSPHDSVQNRIAYSNDGNYLATGDVEGVLKFWDVNALAQPFHFKAHPLGLCSLAVSPRGDVLVTGGSDGGLRLWDMKKGRIVRLFEGHQAPVWSIAFHPDGQRFISTGFDGKISLWDTARSQAIRSISTGLDWPHEAHYDPTGRYFAAADRPGEIRIWDADTGEHLQTFSGQSTFEFTPDGQSILTGNIDGRLTLWDFKTGVEQKRLPSPDVSIAALCVSPSGAYLAVGGHSGTVEVWDMTKEEKLNTLPSGTDHIHELAFSPDDTRLVVACDDGTVRLWEPFLGRVVLTLKNDSTSVRALNFSADGEHILAGLKNGEILTWSAIPWNMELNESQILALKRDNWAREITHYHEDSTGGVLDFKSEINVRRDSLVDMLKNITDLVERLGYMDAPMGGVGLLSTPGLEFLMDLGFEHDDIVIDFGDISFDTPRNILVLQQEVQSRKRDHVTIRVRRNGVMRTLNFNVLDE